MIAVSKLPSISVTSHIIIQTTLIEQEDPINTANEIKGMNYPL